MCIRDRPQPYKGILIPVPDNGILKFLFKVLASKQESRHQVIKYAPDFTEPVLNRCPCQCKTATDINGLDCFGALGGRILDVLRLVNDLVAEMDVLIEPDVAFEQVIGSDQNLACLLYTSRCV